MSAPTLAARGDETGAAIREFRTALAVGIAPWLAVSGEDVEAAARAMEELDGGRAILYHGDWRSLARAALAAGRGQ